MVYSDVSLEFELTYIALVTSLVNNNIASSIELLGAMRMHLAALQTNTVKARAMNSFRVSPLSPFLLTIAKVNPRTDTQDNAALGRYIHPNKDV